MRSFGFVVGFALAILLVIVLAIRVGIGPYVALFGEVRSPLGPATVMFYCIAGVIALRVSSNRLESVGPESRIWLYGLLAFSAIFCVGLFVLASGDAFLSDDYVLLVRAATDNNSLSRVWSEAGGDGAYRPIGAYFFHGISSFARFSPHAWRYVSLAIHLLNAVCLFVLCRKLWPSRDAIAPLACALFLVHGTRPEVVYWTAGSFDLLACGFSLLSILWWVSSPPPALRWLGTAAFLALALLSKESAYAAPLIGVVLLVTSEEPSNKKIRTFAALSIGLSGLFAIHRLLLFGGPGGYVDALSGRPQILSLSPISTVKALSARVWEALFLPLNWAAGESWLAAAALLVYVGSLLLIGGRSAQLSKRNLLLLASGVVLLVLPALHLALVGESLLGSRVLYFPSVAFCILMAACLPTKGVLVKVCLLGIVSSQCVFLAHNLFGWRSASILADSVCEQGLSLHGNIHEIPAQFRGGYVFANGYPECLSMKEMLSGEARKAAE